MADIFISFIHEEERMAEAVKELLRAKLQTNSFLSSDKWSIFAGDEWLERVAEALTGAKVIVLMLSNNSVKRPWVNFEAGAAWFNKVVIPVCICGLRVEDLPKPYSNRQSLRLEDDEGPYYLVSSIHHHLKLPSLTPPPFSSDDSDVANLRRAFSAQ